MPAKTPFLLYLFISSPVLSESFSTEIVAQMYAEYQEKLNGGIASSYLVINIARDKEQIIWTDATKINHYLGVIDNDIISRATSQQRYMPSRTQWITSALAFEDNSAVRQILHNETLWQR